MVAIVVRLSLVFTMLVFSAFSGVAAGLSEWAGFLKSLGLHYNANARIPGEEKSLTMDCSNTARYLIQKTRGIDLPRTASDQYIFVKKYGRLKRAGGIFGGTPDLAWWKKRLEPGDLLFWEHTYKPKRRPPVTHVMVYLGPDENGTPLMAGAQNSRGVNIYELRPRVAYGGHGGFFGLFKKKGKLAAYGRLP